MVSSIVKKMVLKNKITYYEYIYYLAKYNIYRRGIMGSILYKKDIHRVLYYIYNYPTYINKYLGIVTFEDMFEIKYNNILNLPILDVDDTAFKYGMMVNHVSYTKYIILKMYFNKFYDTVMRVGSYQELNT